MIVCAGCTKQEERKIMQPSIGQAYVGPMTMKIRHELAPSSDPVATVNHGDKLDIISTRRRFVRVRTSSGTEGWTDANQLLSVREMNELQNLRGYAASLPPMGTGKAYEALNMHGKPDRHSPGFYQLAENSVLEVVAHRLTPRTTAAEAPEPLVVKPPKPIRKKKTSEKRKLISELGQPPVPQPPSNWVQLSKTNPPPPIAEELRKQAEAAKKKEPVKMDDWYLVRTPDKKHAGWVLSRMVSMAIPDEVAQYSEGSRITSYFPLGEVTDEDGKTHKHYLWTTIKHGGEQYDFDAFRVFIWSRRHHRYETAYQERGVEGYYPVTLHPVQFTEGIKTKLTQTLPGFDVLLVGDDNNTYKCTYAFEPSKVHFVGRERVARPPQPADPEAIPDWRPDQNPALAQQNGKLPWFAKFKERVMAMWKKPGPKND